MKKQHLFLILLFIAALPIGYLGGYLLGKYVIVDSVTFKDVLYFILISIFIQFLVVNIHEFGHFIFGKSLGYRLVMYHVGPFAFTYENGKMIFSLKRMKGAGGLCAMIPAKGTNSLEKKHLFYYAGGIIFNLLTGVISLLALFLVSSSYGQITLYFFAGYSIILGLANLIPYKVSGNYVSDGKFIIGILKQDPATVSMLTLQNTYTQLAGGIRPKNLIIETDSSTDNNDPSLLLLQYYQAIDQEDRQAAISIAEELTKLLDKVPSIALPGYHYELLTTGILFDRPEWIETYYPLVKKRLKKDRDLNGERVNAYYASYLGDDTLAKKHIEQARSVANKFPIRGQVKMELMLIDQLAEQINLAAVSAK